MGLCRNRKIYPFPFISPVTSTTNNHQILTMRLIMYIMSNLAKFFAPNGYKTVSTCKQLIFMYEDKSFPLSELFERYSVCANVVDSSETVYVVVNAFMKRARPEELAAILGLTFGPAMWMAQVIHVLAAEWYLNETKREDERLKEVSRLRRKAAGMVEQ